MHAEQLFRRAASRRCAHTRDDLLVLLRHGVRRRTAGSSVKAEEAGRSQKTGSLICGALWLRRQPRFALRASLRHRVTTNPPALPCLPSNSFLGRQKSSSCLVTVAVVPNSIATVPFSASVQNEKHLLTMTLDVERNPVQVSYVNLWRRNGNRIRLMFRVVPLMSRAGWPFQTIRLCRDNGARR